MSDDLIQYLRDSKGWPRLGEEAANRIEELEKQNASLEAKLAKAMEVLRLIEAACEADYPPSHLAIKYAARATLAELKGEQL